MTGKPHKSKEIRKLKIYPMHRFSGRHTSVVPEIRIRGKWLAKLGFKWGEVVQLKVENYKITITLQKDLIP